jgi:predicted RNA binding protein YcfA (HicA-like mRNA interferase family)
MKLPRDISGTEVARRLARHDGYRVTRSRGSHMTVTLTAGGDQHQVTVPQHRDVRVGTLDAIIADVAAFLGLPKRAVHDTLFG